MTIALLLKNIPFEEFDYQTLLDSLPGYAQPRMKISGMLARGDIIRVKKGLYVLGESFRRRPYCRELLANLIYGPSCVSLDYALQYHGLIPERVESVTSVTCGRPRVFDTPVGIFSYKMIPMEAYRTGIDRIELDDGRSFLMAIPEKALADRIATDRGASISSRKGLYEYLTADLRVDMEGLRKLDHTRLAEIAGLYRSRRIRLLSDLVRRLSPNGKEVLHA